MKKLILILFLGLGITFAVGRVNKNSVGNKMFNSTAFSQQQTNIKTPISISELKAGITDDISKSYPDYKILEAYKVENTDGKILSYDVLIASNTKKIDLFYDKDGNYLSKRDVVNPIPSYQL